MMIVISDPYLCIILYHTIDVEGKSTTAPMALFEKALKDLKECDSNEDQKGISDIYFMVVI